jgi:hypothetical protein
MATIVADKRELVGDDELNDGDHETASNNIRVSSEFGSTTDICAV